MCFYTLEIFALQQFYLQMKLVLIWTNKPLKNLNGAIDVNDPLSPQKNCDSLVLSLTTPLLQEAG